MEPSDTGMPKLARLEEFRCPHCGFTSTDKARVEKCTELCAQLRTLLAEKAAMGAERPADPQEQPTLPTEQYAPPAGELRPRPMRPALRMVGEAPPAPAATESRPFQIDPKMLKWSRLGYRVVHDHSHSLEPGKDPDIIVLILAR